MHLCSYFPQDVINKEPTNGRYWPVVVFWYGKLWYTSLDMDVCPHPTCDQPPLVVLISARSSCSFWGCYQRRQVYFYLFSGCQWSLSVVFMTTIHVVIALFSQTLTGFWRREGKKVSKGLTQCSRPHPDSRRNLPGNKKHHMTSFFHCEMF